MGNLFSCCISGDSDQHRQPSPRSSRHFISHACPTSAEVVTQDTISVQMVAHSNLSSHRRSLCPSSADDGTKDTVSSQMNVQSRESSLPKPLGLPSAEDENKDKDQHNFENDTSENDQAYIASSVGNIATLQSRDTEISLSSFTLHGMLGQGGFGRVFLATHHEKQETMAIKSVTKTKGNYDTVENERQILETVEGSPFLIQLYAAFQTRASACFVMEYVCGGSLFDFLSNYSPLHIDTIRFIVAEIACGLENLHKHNIVHRDIKLDNILIDGVGHIRIADFGLAVAGLCDHKIVTGTAGTLGYMAPEVVNNDFYRFEPDWFSLGVVTYIMATGHRPFKSSNSRDYMEEVNFTNPVYPPNMNPELKNFIEGLLCKCPDERLGVRDNIRDHIFMDSINWEDLEEWAAIPPFQLQPMYLDFQTPLSPSSIDSPSFCPHEEIYLDGFTHIGKVWEHL